MCGLIYYSSNKSRVIANGLCQVSAKSMHHRGPDNTGWIVEGNTFMGHNRLSIIDLDPSANQPFTYLDNVIIYNGEIFNYVELKNDLISRGYCFKTNSDTEVVLLSFIEYGFDCFNKFNGMWALAIYNKTTKRLVASRDRYGQKPLFVYFGNNEIILGSELHAVQKLVKSNPDTNTIKLFLN